MKKLFVFFLLISLLLCGCSSQQQKISYNDDYSELYYNGRTYIGYPWTSGKYRVDYDQCIELGRLSAGIFGRNTYYGDDAENPKFISEKRVGALFVREDLCIDHSTTLTIQQDDKIFSFAIEEAVTGSYVAFDIEQKADYAQVLNYEAQIEYMPQVSLNVLISKRDGVYYLQDCHNSDYYVITEEFLDQLINEL